MKICEELLEFTQEQDMHKRDLEAIDVLHAVETFLRIRFAGREDVLDSIIEQVVSKNRARGKYS